MRGLRELRELEVAELWDALVEDDFFTESELQLITDMCGCTVETLNAAIFARYGYENYEQLKEDL